jgi:hypothetical protein
MDPLYQKVPAQYQSSVDFKLRREQSREMEAPHNQHHHWVVVALKQQPRRSFRLIHPVSKFFKRQMRFGLVKLGKDRLGLWRRYITITLTLGKDSLG